MSLIKYFIGFGFSFSAITTFAQEVGQHVSSATQIIVRGHVVDAKTKEALIGVFLKSQHTSLSAVTDEMGAFEITLAADDSLQVSYMGYENQILAVPADGKLEVLLKELSQSGTELRGIVVKGRRKTTTISTSGALKVEKIGANELMKAACCNLSESFETTPSVDVGFTDAVSGYKQIQMLGLTGAHTSFTRENIPDIRGLAAITGLTFTPGTFVESMQLSKGAGSVVNGFEGTAGQINVEWLKPFEESSPDLVLNAYQSTQGRSEANVIYNAKVNSRLSTNVLLHGRGDWMKVDMNDDGFLDNPMGTNFVGANRWFYFHERGWEVQAGLKGVVLNTIGGQKGYERGMPQIGNNPWGYQNEVNRLETWAKIGRLFPDKPYKSMGLQLAANFHEQSNFYGARNYQGRQNSYYLNYIYQTIIGNTNHTIKMGLSTSLDEFKEHLSGYGMQRTEVVPGAFVEYAYKWHDHFNLVAGLRGDYNNLFGAFVTPRLHLRYAPNEKTAIRASVGRAQRTANFFAENMGLMASGRTFQLNGMPLNAQPETDYPFQPEVAWNTGINLTKKFMLNYRDGSFGVDYYFTNFNNQVVVDIEQHNLVNFYNLQGKSYSHSLQVQLDYEPIRFFDLRLAYRFYDVKTTFDHQLMTKPLVAAHRAFANLAYTTKNNWKFDYTVQWMGAKRLPAHYVDHHQMVHASEQTPSFWLMNAQINKEYKDGKLNFYAGVENILNVMQHPMIMGASTPYSDNFDASLIWGSGMGRNIYVGFKYKLGGKELE
jgi:outer membrane receptor for ferrienterochelin and colicins